jgi:hypothetical protein
MTTLCTLINIGLKPTVTARDMLTITRRIVRWLCELRRAQHEAQRALSRLAAIRREYLPFSRRNVEELELLASEYKAKLEATNELLLVYGRNITWDFDGYAESLGFEALADLLNINRVDRQRARGEGWHTLGELVAIHGLENSSESGGDKRGAHSPLYQACFLTMAKFIRTVPEDALSDLFARDVTFRPRIKPGLRLVWPPAQDTAAVSQYS